MGSISSTKDNDTLPTTAASGSGPQTRSPLHDQTQSGVIVLTQETFFEALDDMFQHAEHPHRCSWEAHLYRPWGYILSAWCLTFARRRMSVTCGAQWPFLHRLDGVNSKVLKYVYPDFVLILSNDGLGAVFLVVEIKPLALAGWSTSKGRDVAIATFAKTLPQTRAQARMAFLQHKDQSSIQAFLACGVWWYAVRYSRSEILGEDTPTGTSGGSTSQPTVTKDQSQKRKTKRLRRSRRNKPNKKKTKDVHRSNSAEDDARPLWLPERSDPDPQSSSTSDEDEDVSDPDDPAPRSDEEETIDPRVNFPKTANGHRAVYHIMQLGADKKALNPWFKAFLASVIKGFPDISIDDLQKSWFDQSEEERRLGYIWKDGASLSDDEGFAAGFRLPEGGLPATTDALSDGDILLQVDGSANLIALNKDVDIDFASLTSPQLRLPDGFDFLSPEVLDELAAALMERMTMKQTEGFQPSDFATPRSSAIRASSSATQVPTRPAQHTIHTFDRRSLQFPSSSAFNSDVPFPSSPSPHDRQLDHDGFAIPSLPFHHRIFATQDRSLNLATNLPKSALASAQRSQTRHQPSVHRPHAQLPESGPNDAFLRAIRGEDSTPPQTHDAPASGSSTDSQAPRGQELTAGAPTSSTRNRPREYRDAFATASDIPARRPAPRIRAHSVAGVTRAHAHDSAYDSASEWMIPQASSPGRDYPTHYGAGPREPSGARVVQYPKSKRGEFSSRSTSQVVEVTMHLGPTKSRRKREQEREAGGSGSGDARQPGRDNSGAHDGEPRGKGKGRTG